MPTSSRCWCVVVVTFRADVGIRPYIVGATAWLAFLLLVVPFRADVGIRLCGGVVGII